MFTSETAEQMKVFMIDGDFKDFITFISSNCLSKLCCCVINSITGLIHFNACRISVVILHGHSGK